MKATSLKLNGKPLGDCSLPPTLRALIDFLSKAPEDELYTGNELARKTRLNSNSVRFAGSSPEMEKYSYRLSKVRLYGNPKAIELLRKQVTA